MIRVNVWQAILLGIIEGITEFLPVSSTGHMIIASALMGLSETSFLKSFEISIQLGAILSAVVLYAQRVLKDRDLILKTAIAFLPTGIVGLIAYKAIKEYLLGNQSVVVISLIVGGAIMIVVEAFHRKSSEEPRGKITYSNALVIGIAQCFSMIPGVSRSAATILGGLLLKIDRKTAVEFSFLLAIPTMAAATGLDLLKSGWAFSSNEWILLMVGFVVSFVVALLSIKLLLLFVQRFTFVAFGVYRIIAGIVFWLLLLR